MSNKLEVHFTAQNEYQTEVCLEGKEGDNGIYLFDSYNDQCGYIPYKNLDYVEPIEE